MNPIRGVFAEYVSLRNRGLTQLDTLNKLRGEIEVLTKSSKRELVMVMRAWEKELQKRSGIAPKPDEEDSPNQQVVGGTGILEPLAILEPADDEMVERHKRMTQSMPIVLPLDVDEDGTVSSENENTVVHGGTEVLKSHFIQRAAARKPIKRGTSRFDRNSTLKLFVLGSDKLFEVRPQENEHELFVGRSTMNGALAPDIDLARSNGARLGVSQLHMSIRYLPEDEVLQVLDLGSTNGSFLNGEPLFPDEPRALHHGDELRVGLLAFMIEFKQEVAATV